MCITEYYRYTCVCLISKPKQVIKCCFKLNTEDRLRYLDYSVSDDRIIWNGAECTKWRRDEYIAKKGNCPTCRFNSVMREAYRIAEEEAEQQKNCDPEGWKATSC